MRDKSTTVEYPMTEADTKCKKECPLSRKLLMTAVVVAIALIIPLISIGTAEAHSGGSHGAGIRAGGFRVGGFRNRGFLAARGSVAADLGGRPSVLIIHATMGTYAVT